MRKLKLLPIFALLIIAITACSKKASEDNSSDDNNSNSTPNTVYILEEDNSDIIDSSKTISTLEIVDVPNEPIDIGRFRWAGIKLKATYTDGTTSYKDVTEDMFSEDQKPLFLVPGEAYFDFVYRGNHLPLRFTLVEVSKPSYWPVTFYDRNDRMLQADLLSYMSNAKYRGDTSELDYIEDGKYYKFVGWDKSLKYVCNTLKLHPKYEVSQIAYNYDNYYKSSYGYELLDIYQEDIGVYHAALYLGRVENAKLVDFGTVNRDDYVDETVSFEKYDYSQRAALCKKMADTLKNEFIYKFYKHTSSASSRRSFVSSYLFDFDLSSENEMLFTYTDPDTSSSVEANESFPTYFRKTFAEGGYDETKLQPIERYGSNSSLKSIFNVSDNEIFNAYEDAPTTMKFTEDLPLGYYNISFNADLDVYFDIKYSFVDMGTYFLYYLLDVKIAFTYLPDTLKTTKFYSTEEKINIKGNTFEIYEDYIQDTLDSYHFVH